MKLPLGVLLLTAGCMAPGTELVRDQASADLGCSPEQLRVTHTNDVSEYSDGALFEAAGCGKLAQYGRRGPDVQRTTVIAVDTALPGLRQGPPLGPIGFGRPDLDALTEKRLELARKHIEIVRHQFDKGLGSTATLLGALRLLGLAAHDSHLRGEARIGPLTEYRDAMVAARDHVKQRVESAAASQDELYEVESQLAEAEYWLAEAKPHH